jgi:hypothetical protein
LAGEPEGVPAHHGSPEEPKGLREDDIILQPSVNDTFVRLAPEVPGKELGNILHRMLNLLNVLVEVPPKEHIHFSKMDLADGCWRMVLEPESRWTFAYVMP